MSDIFQTNEVFYRSCILYEALHKKPVEKAYKKMKEVMPTLDFLDFQYWYFRFLNGNRDLNHDKSLEAKTHLLCDMPVDIVERIVKKLDFIDQMATRNASRALRSVVDRVKSDCDYLDLYFYRDSSKLWSIKLFKKEYKTPDHLQLVMKDFATVMHSPNPKFKSLDIEFDYENDYNNYNPNDDDYYNREYYDKEEDDKKRTKLIESILANSEIHVEQLSVKSDTLAPMAAILPSIKPTILESIEFWSQDVDKKILEQIMKMNHWKNARELRFRCIPDWFPIKNLFHCKKFTIGDIDVTEARLEKIRDFLFKSPIFESCSLSCGGGVKNLVNKVMRVHPAYDPESKRYRIEGTNSYFKFEFSKFWGCSLDITKETL